MNGPRARTRVRERIERGEPAVVVAGHTVSADTADFLGRFGFDGYWVEGEHGATTWDRIADISRACELWGMTAMMRIHRLDASLVGRALTLGAGGIVVPQVQTAEEAARSSAPAGSPRPAVVGCRWAGARTADADFFASEARRRRARRATRRHRRARQPRRDPRRGRHRRRLHRPQRSRPVDGPSGRAGPSRRCRPPSPTALGRIAAAGRVPERCARRTASSTSSSLGARFLVRLVRRMDRRRRHPLRARRGRALRPASGAVDPAAACVGRRVARPLRPLSGPGVDAPAHP